ncbi:MAG: hypothetical protein A3F09_03795 [Chlamydiae bacterium RIFCSPHIGHO2_12_FULL_49_11]|nr:MAG: hypothetical protein A3F09_03795 [Chlamydiae bacterium RIFCSPHIGHO2_12_FULL_49_11]
MWCFAHEPTIGFCIVATGKYIDFTPPLIESAEKYFCRGTPKRYFVFSDRTSELPKNAEIIEVRHFSWPFSTAMRNTFYVLHKERLKECDYLFAIDADMRFVSPIAKEEVLGTLVATQHPGFYRMRGSYESNSISKAFVAPNEGEYYFCGGFFGGKREEFIKLCQKTSDNFFEDLKKGFIAEWHDESHHNRYLIDYPPTKILSPAYCYPESWKLPFEKKLLALDKNHAEFQK